MDLGATTVDGVAVVHRLYDVGWQIDLDRAVTLLESRGAERGRPSRGEGAALRIPNPPVSVVLGTEPVVVDGVPCAAEVSARLFDFGVVSMRLAVPVPAGANWSRFTAFGRALHRAAEPVAVLDRHRDALRAQIAGAIDRPQLAPLVEDYIVFRLHALADAAGRPLPITALTDDVLVPLLLDESRPIAPSARRALLPHRFSYYADDLAVLTWDNALVVEPRRDDDTVRYILEFANAQLLELRWYDERLESQLHDVLGRTAQASARGVGRLLTRRHGRLLEDLQRLVVDAAETTERVDNALTVTDDVWLRRVYAAALDVFRGADWRAGIDRKVGILRETYGMLNDESQAARAEVLEATIVALIVVEIAMALV